MNMPSLIRKGFFYSGVGLLCVAAITAFTQPFGLLLFGGYFENGTVPLHMIGRFAVAGCVLAAIGSVD